MELHNLKPAAGSTHSRKRIGRGPGSGKGGTSTRGHKGAKARSGYKKKIGFEGGQMPLQRRLPKFGFKNINRVEYKGINVSTLQALADSKGLTKIGIEELQNALKPSSHFNLIVMGVLLISMVLLGGYLMTQNHTSGQKDTDHPKKANKNAPPTNSSITEEQLTNQKTTFRELTDLEKKEIRNITLSIVQPVYQQEHC